MRTPTVPRARAPWSWCLAAALPVLLVLACSTQAPVDSARHRWWSGLGPVLPHDSFPGDCRLCHRGQTWNSLREDFAFDHEKETGVPLPGAHAHARCLRCHNDRGPVDVFAARGCAGCHEDVHLGRLGPNCTDCHGQDSWFPSADMVSMHNRTRFPLIGAHAVVACSRCHPAAFVGRFQPTDTECVTCHQQDLQFALFPPHLQLGLVDNCHRCHIPTAWKQILPN